MQRENIIKEKTFQFSVKIVKLYKYLIEEKKEYTLSRQILKSGTSIGANVEEADAGISKADFSAKISIAYKEAKETHYWLRLLYETNYLTEKVSKEYLNDCTEICKILFSILKTSRINKQK